MAKEQLEQSATRGQQGGRWINERPSGEELAAWFKTVPLHEGMTHDRYVDGLTLIPATEKVDQLEQNANGRDFIRKVEQIVFTPYVRVDTRVRYYWDLCLMNEDWEGVIEPVKVARKGEAASSYDNDSSLPDGMSYQAVKTEKGVTPYVLATFRAAIYRVGVGDGRPTPGMPRPSARPIIQGVGTKAVPLLRYADRADDNAFMKAETGAVGRALGMAGMLIIGSGVATAEDVRESHDSDARPSPTVDPASVSSPEPVDPAAAVESDEAVIRQQATGLIQELQSDYPKAWAEIVEWSKARNFGKLSDLNGPSLRGFLRKLEKALAAAKVKPPQEAQAEPAEAPEEGS